MRVSMALSIELFRRTWVILALSFFLEYWFVSNAQFESQSSILVIAISVPIFYVIALFATADRSRIPGVSDYTLALPVESASLGFVHMLYGLFTMILLTGFLFYLDPDRIDSLKRTTSELALFHPLGNLFAAGCLYVLFWTVGVKAPRAVLFLAAAFVVGYVGYISTLPSPYSSLQANELYLANVQSSFSFGFMLTIPLALLAFVSNRHEGRGVSFVRFRINAIREVLVGQQSAVATIARMEWRHTYRWVPITTLPILALFILGDVFGEGYSIAPMYFVPPVACAILGLLRDTAALQGYRSNALVYEFLMPVSVQDIAAAKLRASVKAIVVTEAGLVVLLVLATILFDYGYRFDDLAPYFAFGVPAQFAVSWVLIWCAPLLLFAPLVEMSVDESMYGYVLGVVSLVAVAYALRKGLVRPRTLALVGLAVPVLALGATVGLAAARQSQYGMRMDYEPILMTLIASSILLPLALVPIVLHHVRHR